MCVYSQWFETFSYLEIQRREADFCVRHALWQGTLLLAIIVLFAGYKFMRYREREHMVSDINKYLHYIHMTTQRKMLSRAGNMASFYNSIVLIRHVWAFAVIFHFPDCPDHKSKRCC